MKLLVLTNLYPPRYLGGYELICQTVVETLRQRGHIIDILTSDHGVGLSSGSAEEHRVERSLKINGLYGHPWRGIRELRLVERHNNFTLRHALARHAPDLVYVWNMGGLSKSMLFTLQALDIPTVFYISDHWIARGLKADVWLSWWNCLDASLGRRFVRSGLALAGVRKRWDAVAPTNPFRELRFRRLYFCSRALRDLTVSAGFRVGHGAVIYCPIHLRYCLGDPHPSRTPLKRLVYVGRLSADKGVMTALRALAILRGQLPLTLSVVGQGEPEYVAQLKRFSDQNQLQVEFASAGLEQMPAVYRRYDLLLFTSEWAEPFALTPIEAMACGLPVVGTTTGGSAELFRSGQNALTYTAGNDEELAARVAQFAADDTLRARCAWTGCCEARERYAAPVIVDQIEDYLQESLDTWRPTALHASPSAQPSTERSCVF